MDARIPTSLIHMGQIKCASIWTGSCKDEFCRSLPRSDDAIFIVLDSATPQAAANKKAMSPLSVESLAMDEV
jgi:hypothetical protein